VTRVVHTAHCPEVLYASGEPALGLNRYANTYECSPLDEPFVWRPQVPRRPRVEGPQTAIVTAPEGAAEEIVTDHHGRIRVRFPWDAQRTSPQQSRQSSCWVRVAQSWAGDNWGFLFVPRVGMEVIVHFLDGDPDRPIVTGCVYNGANSTPVKLPAKSTQSAIRTQSSPGGGGYNELRFEDAAGEEHVWFRAQKDHTEHVLNDHKVDVDHDDTEVIKHDSSIEVGNNRAIMVKANERHTVQKNRALTVKGNQQREVSGNESVVVHKTRTTHVDQEWNLTADEAANVEVGGSAKVNIKPDEISMEAPSGITFKCGDNKIEMTPMGISMSTSAGAKVSLEGPNITVDGGAMVTVKSGAVLTIQGTLVKIN
jgi:type VI secretion system secreted protein VgrG